MVFHVTQKDIVGAIKSLQLLSIFLLFRRVIGRVVYEGKIVSLDCGKLVNVTNKELSNLGELYEVLF